MRGARRPIDLLSRGRGNVLAHQSALRSQEQVQVLTLHPHRNDLSSIRWDPCLSHGLHRHLHHNQTRLDIAAITARPIPVVTDILRRTKPGANIEAARQRRPLRNSSRPWEPKHSTAARSKSHHERCISRLLPNRHGARRTCIVMEKECSIRHLRLAALVPATPRPHFDDYCEGGSMRPNLA